jgi:hypothetical protein
VWLVLPAMTTAAGPPVAITRPGPAASATTTAAPQEDGTHTADLVLPLIAAGAAGVLGAYAFVRRTRRARARTTPAAAHPAGGVLPPRPYRPGLGEIDRQAGAALVEADDCVRASREELAFAEARFGAEAVEPYARAVRAAEAELMSALRMRQRYDEGVAADEPARRQALTGIVGRCAEAGRRLDAEAAGFDALRALERGTGAALGVAETRFRELTGRTTAAGTTLAALAERYAPAASAAVVGHLEQARDRLVFATGRLNRARQAADLGDSAGAVAQLRAAEGAVAQAGLLVDGVERLAADLAAAEKLVGAALTGAETELAAVRAVLPPTGEGGGPPDAGAAAGEVPDTRKPVSEGAATVAARLDLAPGELRSRVLHADAVLSSVRQEVTGGRPWDPLGALRRIVAAVAPVAGGRTGVLTAAARLTAGSATAAADDVVATHRGVVGATARTRLAAARELLGAADLTGLVRADGLARQARELAEQDIRVHGTPAAGAGDPAGQEPGAAGAVLGGILPAGGTPARFGGPATRARLE